MKNHFTTHDVASMLKVTRVAVRNWIIQGRLKASSTPGGHRRISREDLLKFLEKSGYPKTVIDDYEVIKKGHFIYCWEYHSKGFVQSSHLHNCESCLVYISKSQLCHVLSKQVGYCRVLCMEDCQTCKYYKKYFQK